VSFVDVIARVNANDKNFFITFTFPFLIFNYFLVKVCELTGMHELLLHPPSRASLRNNFLIDQYISNIRAISVDLFSCCIRIIWFFLLLCQIYFFRLDMK